MEKQTKLDNKLYGYTGATKEQYDTAWKMYYNECKYGISSIDLRLL